MRQLNWLPLRRLALGLGLLTLACSGFVGCGDDADHNGAGTPAPTPSLLPSPTAIPIASLHQRFITDEQGRALILHGINVTGSAKDDPRRQPWITQADAERLQSDFGFNVVRYLIFWDALEPSPGQYDDSYLDAVAERVDWFAALGVYVVLDMHQDVYGKLDMSGAVLGFDGAPAWAARTDGLPHRIQNPWALTYVQPGVKRAFDNFWDDGGANQDLQQRYAAMWAHVAARFKGQPWVLGYDIMNEPFAGSAAAGDLGGLKFGHEDASRTFEQQQFHRFYQRVIAAIRAVDPDGWIFYEPLAFPVNNGGPSYLGKLDDPRSGAERLAYFPHLYAVLPEINLHYDPTTTPELDAWVSQRRSDLPALGEPLLIGEFGLPWDAGGDPLGYLRKILNTADELTSGWAYWSYDPGNWAPVTGADHHESPNANELVRAYPQRVAGRPLRYGYDPTTHVLELEFVDQTGVSGPTEIYIPAQRAYADGWHVEMSDSSGSWQSSWDAQREVLSLTTPRRAGSHTVRILPDTAPPRG